PHWLAPCSMKALCISVSPPPPLLPSSPVPSTVTTSPPDASTARTRQDFTSSPLSRTVQRPHSPLQQAAFTLFTSSLSRSRSRRSSLSFTSLILICPFTFTSDSLIVRRLSSRPSSSRLGPSASCNQWRRGHRLHTGQTGKLHGRLFGSSPPKPRPRPQLSLPQENEAGSTRLPHTLTLPPSFSPRERRTRRSRPKIPSQPKTSGRCSSGRADSQKVPNA